MLMIGAGFVVLMSKLGHLNKIQLYYDEEIVVFFLLSQTFT